MSERRTDEGSVAPRRTLAASAGREEGRRPVLPPPPAELRQPAQPREREAEGRRASPSQPEGPPPGVVPPSPAGRPPRRRTRKARLRLVQVDAWSVMKTSFLLSIAIGIVTIVAVAIVWSVLGASGVWDSINSMVQQALGSENGTPFEIQRYVSTSRVLGLTMLLAVLDVILITAISTLAAFLYNLAAALLGGIEVILAEDPR